MKTSLLDRLLGGDQTGEPREVQNLLDLKARISHLQNATMTIGVFGGGVTQALEQIPIICRNLDEAVVAMRTGLDPHGQPITKGQIASGLKRLVNATREPAFTGLMSVILAANHIQELEGYMNELDQIANKIGVEGRKSWLDSGLMVGLAAGLAGGIGFGIPYVVSLALRLLFPILDTRARAPVSCVALLAAIGLGYLALRTVNKAIIRRGVNGLGYTGEGTGRVVLGVLGVIAGGLISAILFTPVFLLMITLMAPR